MFTSKIEIAFLCATLLGLFIGCGGPSAVDAIPRQSKFKPKLVADQMISEDSDDPVLVAKNDLDVSFLHEDHVACLQIAVDRILANPDFQDVPWDSLEEQLRPLIGEENSKLANILRGWILLDRDNLNLVAAQGSASPLVFVLEYANPVQDLQLAEVSEARMSAEDADANFFVEKLDDNRIALGAANLLRKLRKKNGSQTAIARKFSQLDETCELNGVLLFGPMRGLLQSVAGMASAFGNGNQALSALPEALEHLELQLSVSGDELVSARIFLNDAGLAEDLSQLIQESLGDGSGGNGAAFEAFRGSPPEMMIPIRSTNLLSQVGKDIQERQLLSVSSGEMSGDYFVSLTLEPPEKIKELVSAVIEDARQQALLLERTQQFNEIAEAMKKYEQQYGCLPSSEALLDHPDGLPNQFSWRVALLPLLGEQELYEKFDFSQPWDSPANLSAAENIPAVFRDIVTEKDNPNVRTRIHIAAGPDGVYRDDRPIPKLEEISDKRIWTAIVIEGGDESREIWTKPAALPISSLSSKKVGRRPENGFLMINAAFKTRILKKNNENLAAVLSSSGGESLKRRDFLEAESQRR